MIASVYIKNGNIHFYNENSLSNIGGIEYALGRPLLDFVCYEPERFDDAFSIIASVYDNEYAYLAATEEPYISTLKESMTEFQTKETYIFFYAQMLMEFIFAFIDSPRQAIMLLEDKLPGAEEKLRWTMDFEWPASSSPYIEVRYADKEKRLLRAAMDVVALMSESLKQKQEAMINEIELLLSFREVIGTPETTSLEFIYWIESYRLENTGESFYLENPLRSFYSALPTREVVELYEINTIDELFRFEFIKMIEHDIFIKKCKNCDRFFIPRRRADAEYCERIYGDGKRKCSEIGAMLRYERKVAGDPVLEAYSKAYKRFNSRARAKRMSQSEFLSWSEQARKLRDECLAGELSFEEFTAWLDQGRVRRKRRSGGRPLQGEG